MRPHFAQRYRLMLSSEIPAVRKQLQDFYGTDELFNVESRTPFLANYSNDYYLTITESKRRFKEDGFVYEKHKIFLYKEDFDKFVAALNETVDHVKNELMRANGSIQHIEGIPENIKELYKTVWEMSMRDIIDMAADRGAFIDQSQSLNLFVENPNAGKLTSMHFYAWKKGLKTGMYYLRSKAASSAIKFTVAKNAKPEVEPIVNTKEQVKEYEEPKATAAVVAAKNRRRASKKNRGKLASRPHSDEHFGSMDDD